MIDTAVITSLLHLYGQQRRKIWCTWNNALDERLSCWLIRMWERSIFLTDNFIQEGARNSFSAYNTPFTDHELFKCKFRSSWLRKFKKRHKLKCFKCHGEAKILIMRVLGHFCPVCVHWWHTMR